MTSTQSYEIRSDPSNVAKGLGIYATQLIAQGTAIVKDEKPVFIARHEDDSDFYDFDNLEPDQREYLETLSGSPQDKKGNPVEVTNGTRFDCNNWNLGKIKVGEGEYGGVFETLGRINHSCFPNAMFDWNNTTKTANLHALRAIRNGEEITASYFGDGIWDRPNRRKTYLLTHYGFECKCEVCMLTKRGDGLRLRRRSELRSFAQEMRGLPSFPDSDYIEGKFWADELLRNVAKMCNLLEVELGMTANAGENELPQTLDPFLAEVCRLAAKCEMLVRADPNPEREIFYLRKALAIDRICYGVDSPQVIQEEEILATKEMEIPGAAPQAPSKKRKASSSRELSPRRVMPRKSKDVLKRLKDSKQKSKEVQKRAQDLVKKRKSKD